MSNNRLPAGPTLANAQGLPKVGPIPMFKFQFALQEAGTPLTPISEVTAPNAISAALICLAQLGGDTSKIAQLVIRKVESPIITPV